jgi:hypothetical protein
MAAASYHRSRVSVPIASIIITFPANIIISSVVFSLNTGTM